MKSRVTAEAGRAFLAALDMVVAASQPSPKVQLRLQAGLRRRETVDTAVHGSDQVLQRWNFAAI